MIHWTPEGYTCKVGLNFYVTLKGCKWFRIVWCWYDCSSYTKSGWYFRFRWGITPHFIWKVYPLESVIDSYCFERNLKIVKRRS